MIRLSDWPIAIRLARRELRGGLKGFRLFLACLALGVAAIAAVGSLAAGIAASLAADGRAILGGDAEVRFTQRPANAAELTWLTDQGRISQTAQMRSMAYAKAASDTAGEVPRTLVELKAVDNAYPLFGSAVLRPDLPLQQALSRQQGEYGVVVDATLLARLKLQIGDGLAIGDATYRVRAVLDTEPDRGTEGLTLGPRVMVALDSLPGTGLVTLGSLMSYQYRLALPPGTDLTGFTEAANATFPEAGWRVRDWRNANQGFRQFVDRIGLFLVLVGLTALLVGGVGVGNAVRAYLEGKTGTIATLKCLGAPGGLIFRVYLVQVMALAAGGVALGLFIGAALPPLAVMALGELLPVPVKLGVYPAPLALAALYGLLIGLAFTLWPLARARDVAPAGLFRDLVAPLRRWPRPSYLLAIAGLFALLALVAVFSTNEKIFAVGFVVGSAASFAFLGLVALGLMALARRLGRPRSTALRLALTNLYRPGAPTVSIVLSLGLGLALLIGIALIQGNLVQQVQERLPASAPAFFFIDIQPDQVAAFDALAKSIPGVEEVNRVPSLRGRISKVNGVDADRAPISSDQRWVLRGDRGLTYAALPPAGATLTEGSWWPADYHGPLLLSLEAEAAKGLGLKLGDSITINLLGREIDAWIANLRRVDWASLGINFVMIFSPGILDSAPQTHIATIRVSAAGEEPLYRAITDRFPNIATIRVKEILEQLNSVLGQVAQAVRIAAAVTILAGLLVLAGAIIAGHRRRVRDAVVLKVLGATRFDVLRVYLLEYVLLGGVTAIIAGGIGWLSAWLVLTRVMNAPFVPLPGTLAVAALGGMVVTVLLGLAGTWRALSQRPAPILRTL